MNKIIRCLGQKKKKSKAYIHKIGKYDTDSRNNPNEYEDSTKLSTTSIIYIIVYTEIQRLQHNNEQKLEEVYYKKMRVVVRRALIYP